MNQAKVDNIAGVLSKQGRNVVAGTIYDFIQIWKSWYRGNVNSFHQYTRTGVTGEKINCEKLTFGLPKLIGEAWASFLINEKVLFNTNNETINIRLLEVLEENSYRVELTDLVEKVFGYAGLGAIVEYLINGKTVIDYIIGEFVLITEGTGTQATGIITVNEIQRGKQFITHLTMHNLVKETYVIEHQAFISEKSEDLGTQSAKALLHIFTEEQLESMKEVMKDEDGRVIAVRYVTIHETTIPFFQLIRPNVTNNYDTNSKMGIPVTANSIDTFKALDNAYTSLDNEAENNRTLVVFNDKATKKKARNNPETGETSYVQYVDKNDTTFISAPMGDNEDWVKRFKGDFVAEPYISTINKNLSWGGFKGGLGTGYFSFDGTDVYVNEKQIISTNNDIWKNKVKHEIILNEAFVGMIKAIIFLEQSQGRMPLTDIDKLDINVKFDDSIIIDDEELKRNSLSLVDNGYKPKWRHLVEFEGMTEQEAKESIALAAEEDNAAFELVVPPIVDDDE